VVVNSKRAVETALWALLIILFCTTAQKAVQKDIGDDQDCNGNTENGIHRPLAHGVTEEIDAVVKGIHHAIQHLGRQALLLHFLQGPSHKMTAQQSRAVRARQAGNDMLNAA